MLAQNYYRRRYPIHNYYTVTPFFIIPGGLLASLSHKLLLDLVIFFWEKTL